MENKHANRRGMSEKKIDIPELADFFRKSGRTHDALLVVFRRMYKDLGKMIKGVSDPRVIPSLFTDTVISWSRFVRDVGNYTIDQQSIKDFLEMVKMHESALDPRENYQLIERLVGKENTSISESPSQTQVAV